MEKPGGSAPEEGRDSGGWRRRYLALVCDLAIVGIPVLYTETVLLGVLNRSYPADFFYVSEVLSPFSLGNISGMYLILDISAILIGLAIFLIYRRLIRRSSYRATFGEVLSGMAVSGDKCGTSGSGTWMTGDRKNLAKGVLITLALVICVYNTLSSPNYFREIFGPVHPVTSVTDLVRNDIGVSVEKIDNNHFLVTYLGGPAGEPCTNIEARVTDDLGHELSTTLTAGKYSTRPLPAGRSGFVNGSFYKPSHVVVRATIVGRIWNVYNGTFP